MRRLPRGRSMGRGRRDGTDPHAGQPTSQPTDRTNRCSPAPPAMDLQQLLLLQLQRKGARYCASRGLVAVAAAAEHVHAAAQVGLLLLLLLLS